MKKDNNTLTWPMNLMYEIFGYRGHICIDEDTNLDMSNIHEVEERLLKALNELTIWEKDILLRVYRDEESLTSISKFYNTSIDRLYLEMKSATTRMRRTKTKSHDVLVYNDKNHSERITCVIREDKTKDVSINTSISDLPLSTRSFNILARMNIKTIQDLIKYSEADLSNFTNMGKVSLLEVTNIVKKYGFSFAAN